MTTTANKTQPKGLGKGLSALMGDSAIKPAAASTANGQGAAASVSSATPPRLSVTALKAGKYQPRRHFDDGAIAELATSIKKHGLMQPIVVRAAGSGKYEIIAGERRYRAAVLAGLAEVPVLIRSVSDVQALELALIENIQRADLNPLEEAAGYQRLIDEFGYTQEQLAPVVGKSRSHIANLLRLLKLPESVKRRIDSGELTMGHARALLASEDPEALANKIVEIGLSVREAENYAKGGVPPQAGVGSAPTSTPRSMPTTRDEFSAARGAAAKSEDILQLESMLSNNLGLRVGIIAKNGQAGEVVIAYDTLTQLDDILRRLGGSI